MTRKRGVRGRHLGGIWEVHTFEVVAERRPFLYVSLHLITVVGAVATESSPSGAKGIGGPSG